MRVSSTLCILACVQPPHVCHRDDCSGFLNFCISVDLKSECCVIVIELANGGSSCEMMPRIVLFVIYLRDIFVV